MIEKVSNHTHLGITLNETLSWDNHINKLIERTTGPIGLLKHMNHFIDRKSKLPVYTTFIRPKLGCGSQVFDSQLTCNEKDRLESIQRKAPLACTAAYACTSHDTLLKYVGLEPYITVCTTALWFPLPCVDESL